MTIRVLVVDDQKLIREGLGLMLNGAGPEVELAGLAADGEEALRLMAGQPADVVLMDLRMPGMDGIEATRRIKTQYDRTKIIALTTFDDDDLIFGVLKAGADGYLLKDVGKEEIVSAAKSAMQGDAPISPRIAAKVIQRVTMAETRPDSPDDDGLPELSARDREILSLMAEGLDNDAIAQRLFVSRGTVKNYLSRIYERLGVSGRTEAVAVFMKCLKG